MWYLCVYVVFVCVCEAMHVYAEMYVCLCGGTRVCVGLCMFVWRFAHLCCDAHVYVEICSVCVRECLGGHMCVRVCLGANMYVYAEIRMFMERCAMCMFVYDYVQICMCRRRSACDVYVAICTFVWRCAMRLFVYVYVEICNVHVCICLCMFVWVYAEMY